MEDVFLIISLALIASICSVALFANWYANRLVPGLLSIAIGFAVTALGLLLLTTQGSLHPMISVLLANSMIMAGRIPILIGLAAFWNQEKSKLPMISIVWLIGSVIAFYYFTIIDASVIWRIRIYAAMIFVSCLFAIYIIVNGLKIERRLRPVMAISTNYGAYGLIGLFSFNAVTEAGLALTRQNVPLTDSDTSAVLLLFAAMVSILIIALSVLIMTMEELSVEHKENAIFDPITTILNHRTFLEVSQRVLGVALRYSKPVSMLTIEVVNLDQIANQFGVRIANELLRHFSLMATDRRRNEDVLARSGFNQFHMLLPGVDEAGAQVVITKIKHAVMGEDFVYRGNKLDIKLVIASITKREEDLHLQQMLQESEVELFKQKRKLEDAPVA